MCSSAQPIPVKVWLYPLAKLDHRAAQLVREISTDLVSRAQSALEQLSECEVRCQDLVGTTDRSLPLLHVKVQHFQDLCKRYRKTFQEHVANLLPSIRGGEQEEGALRELLTRKEQSPFHPKWLSKWLDKKSLEMDCVKLFCMTLKGVDIIPSEGKLKEVLLDHQFKYVVSFTFTSLQTEEPYFRDLEEWIQKNSDPSSTVSGYEKQIPQQWFEEEAVIRKVRKHIESFADFVSLNKENSKVRFIISSVPDVDHPGVSIYLYKEGQLVSPDFEPPRTPLPPAVGEIWHDRVQLRFEPGVGRRAPNSSCWVEHRILGQKRWMGLSATNGEETFVVRNLLPNTSYQFRCALHSEPGFGECSCKSKVVKTLPTSPPGKPQNTVVTSSAVCVTWKHPSVLGEGVEIKAHLVRYAEEAAAAEGGESGTGGWTSVTVGKNSRCCRVTGLRPETAYRFHVVAVASDGGESAPSEEAVIATLRGEENASKCSSSTNVPSPRPRTMSLGNDGEPELRIVLIGRSGSGKSALGNAILGRRAFQSVLEGNSTVGKCQRGNGIWDGQKVSLIDTATIFDSDICSLDALTELKLCIDLSQPGPHALVLVTQADRFTAEDKAAAERVLDVFGMDATRYMILLLTRQDSGGCSMQDYSSDKEAFQELSQKCEFRICTFSHHAAQEERAQQVSELMVTLQKLVCKNRGEPYLSTLHAEAGLTASKLRCHVAENRGAQRCTEAHRGKELSELKRTNLQRIASGVVASVLYVIYCFQFLYFLSRKVL